MGGGQFGTALSAVHDASTTPGGRSTRSSPEGRPGFEGSRVAAWELRQAGVPHAVVTDAAAPGCIAAGEVAAVLVAADRIARQRRRRRDRGATRWRWRRGGRDAVPGVRGDDGASTSPRPDGDGGDDRGGPARAPCCGPAGRAIAPEGTQVRNPLQDLTPAALVTAIVTERGVLRAPYGPAIAAAVAAADEPVGGPRVRGPPRQARGGRTR